MAYQKTYRTQYNNKKPNRSPVMTLQELIKTRNLAPSPTRRKFKKTGGDIKVEFKNGRYNYYKKSDLDKWADENLEPKANEAVKNNQGESNEQ